MPGRTGNSALVGGVALLGSMVLCAGLVSCSTLQRTVVVAPEIEGATFAGNRACLECHSQYVKVFASTPHARVHIENTKAAGLTGCESCHGPGSKHIAAGGGRGKFIVNPGKEPSACFQCHIEIRAQFSLPFALNEPAGTWKLEFTDVATQVKKSVAIKVQ